jgi:hypothetical protein
MTRTEQFDAACADVTQRREANYGHPLDNPDHLDSAIDIAGYARTIVMALDEQEKRDG